MGEKDAAEKTLETYEDVFADIVNVLLFDGKQEVREEDLEEETRRSVYKADGKLHEQERDTSKYWKDCMVRLALYGVENQTERDRDMPLRIIGYDGASYRRQLLKERKVKRKGKEIWEQYQKRRYPVVTLVLYFGEKRWEGPLSLKECVEIPKGLEGYVNDYRVNLYEIAWLSREQVEKFRSDFGLVADYFVQMRETGRYEPGEREVRHVDEVLKLLSVMTGDHRFEEIQTEKWKEKGGEKGTMRMRTVLDEILTEGEAKGRELGLTSALRSLMKTAGCSAERAMELLEIPEKERESYLEKLKPSS